MYFSSLLDFISLFSTIFAIYSHLVFHLSSLLGSPTSTAVFYPRCIACPSCAYANDHLFRFCQMCGYKRKSVPRQPASKVKVDLAAIDARLQQLTQTANTSSYSKQKSSLRVEFETFLASLPNTKSIYSASPEDVSRFLIWKDRHGKRVVHVAECVNAPN